MSALHGEEDDVDMAHELERVVSELAERYPVYPRTALQGLVQRTYEPYRHAPVQTFVALLVKREAQAQLRYLQEGEVTPTIGAERTVPGPAGSSRSQLFGSSQTAAQSA